jgi:glyoxylase-like metal-dependent hydrolase (beta-lactamase superfamily II)
MTMKASTNSVVRAACAAFALAVLITATPGAQQQAEPDFSAVEYKVNKIGGNFYTIQGAGPGFYPAPNGRPIATLGVLAGPDGVLMVDAGFAQVTDKVLAAVKQISPDAHIRFMVTTHLHQDHSGGNENFGKLGVALLGRDELYARMSKAGRGGPPPAASLPMMTYRSAQTIRMNGEEVRLIPVPGAHTDGDTVVHFVNADAIMTGDVFRADNSYPNIDLNNGGSLQGFLGALETIANLAGPNTKIIPGHGNVTDKNAVLAQRTMAIAVRDRIAALVKEGRTQEEVNAAKVTAAYDGSGPQAMTNAARFITQVYTEVSRSK